MGCPRHGGRSRRCRFQSDVWYAEYGVLVELDGKAYHRGQAALDDMDRDNDHQLVGAITLRFGWRPVASAPCQGGREGDPRLRCRGWPDTRCQVEKQNRLT